MSATFLTRLFPDIAGTMWQYLPGLWNNLFPPALQETCPLQVYYFGKQRLIMPTLIPIALAGIVAGLKGWQNSSHSGLYRRGFLYFAFMNFSAIICHSFVSYDSRLKPWAWGLDVGFTCISSMYLVAAALSGRGSPPVDKLLHRFTSRLPLPLLLIAVYGNLEKLPWLNELMYIGVTGLAVAALLWCEMAKPLTGKNEGRGWIWGCAVSAALALSGVPLDKYLCPLLGSHFNHVHLLFAGCVGSFLCLDKYLAANEKLKSS